MKFGGLKRKTIRNRQAVLFKNYIDSHNEIEGQLIVDYVDDTDTYLVQPPSRFQLNMRRMTAILKFTRPLGEFERIVCFLRNNTNIVDSIEVRLFQSKFQMTTGSSIDEAKFSAGNTVLLLRVVSSEYQQEKIILKVRGARILEERENNQIVVGETEEFLSSVPEETINILLEKAREKSAWIVATLDPYNQISYIQERPRGTIVKASTLARTV